MDDEVGYKKPPKKNQFGQPEGNPIGKTSAQKRLEMENAERATRLRNAMLSALEKQLADAEAEGDAQAIGMINKDILKLLKDSEDRGLGTPVQSVNVESPQGTMTPQTVTRTIIDPKEDG